MISLVTAYNSQHSPVNNLKKLKIKNISERQKYMSKIKEVKVFKLPRKRKKGSKIGLQVSGKNLGDIDETKTLLGFFYS